jgi:hypothetical protein
VTLSRRAFLQLSAAAGASLTVASLPAVTVSASTFTHESAYAFYAADVYHATASHVVTRLFPNRVYRVIESRDGWYRLAEGWVRQESMFPCNVNPIQPAMLHIGDLAEVVTPFACVYPFASSQVAPVKQLGQGVPAMISDMLPATASASAWVKLADATQREIGWSPAACWSTVAHAVQPAVSMFTVDRSARMAHLLRDDHVLLSAPIAFAERVRTGEYPVTLQHAALQSHGSSWMLMFGAYTLAGSHTHNRFGLHEMRQGGVSVQALPAHAKMIYIASPSVVRVI